MVELFCIYGYKFLYGNKRKISQYCQSPLILLKCMGCNNIYILLPFNFLFVSNQTILNRKSLCLKTIETIAIVKTIADTIGIATFLSMRHHCLGYYCDISIVRCINTSLCFMSHLTIFSIMLGCFLSFWVEPELSR